MNEEEKTQKAKIKFINIGDCLMSVVDKEENLDNNGEFIIVNLVNKCGDQQKMLLNVWQEVIAYRYYSGHLLNNIEKFTTTGLSESKIKSNMKRTAEYFSKMILKEITDDYRKIAELYSDTVKSAFEVGKTMKNKKILEYKFSIDGLDKWINMQLEAQIKE